MNNNPVKPIPEGFRTLTPFMVVKGADQIIEFLKRAFDAREHSMYRLPDGSIMHAEIQVGDSMLMMSEATEMFPPMAAMLHIYTEDVDGWYRKAIDAGGISLREPTDEFYGDRSCGVKDAAGNQWWIATHVEDVSPEEMKKRQDSFMNQQQSAGNS
jgi:uncharacterized glyoxalase superfamily protein PhnB